MAITDIYTQLGILVLALAMFFSMRRFPNRSLANRRAKARTAAQSNRHFIQGSSLLARARSSSNRTQTTYLAQTAATEAEAAIALCPKDAAPHILKALAMELMGRRSSALRSLDLALSAPRVKSLSERERSEALAKRAEMKLAMGGRRKAESAVEDATEALRQSADGRSKSRALWVLGECWEAKGSSEEARRAFEEALEVEPECEAARAALDRLRSS